MHSTAPRLGEAPESFVAAFGRPEVGQSVENGYVLRFVVNERDLVVLFIGGVAVALRCGPSRDPDPAAPPIPRDFIAQKHRPDHQLFIPRPDGSWLLTLRWCPAEYLNALDDGSLR